MAFLVELAEWPSGERRGQVPWRGLVLDRALNGGATLTFEVDNDAQAAAYARLGTAVARVWEDGALRFQGRVREPIVARPGTVEVSAGSPYTLLDRRQVAAAVTYTATEQTAILNGILTTQNTRGPTGLKPDPTPIASVTRTRTYERGKSVQEIFAEMAALATGPYFVEVPTIDTAHPEILATLDLRYPNPGTDRPAARFQYGPGTLDNLAGYQLTQALPRNLVHVSGDATLTPANASDAASQAAYGLLEHWFSDSDIKTAAVLTDRANARLRPDPLTQVEIEPVPSGPAVTAPGVNPKLWDDYDLGDTVYVSIRDETTELMDLAQLVTQTRLTVSEDDDSETVEIVLQTPGVEPE